MSTRVTTNPLDFQAEHVAYNIPHTLMAASARSGGIAVWHRDGGDTRNWAMGPSWTSNGLNITCICLAAPEFGNVLCAGTAQGTVCIWAQTPAGNWEQRCQLACSARPATVACFAPRHMGPIVALAFADGFIRTLIASGPLDAEYWDLHSEFEVDTTGKACTCLDWREHDSTLPPLLIVGCAAGRAEVCTFHATKLSWERVATLGTSSDDYGGSSISDVSWAPTLGHPTDRVAVAAGNRVVVWSLRGAVDSLEVERVAVLEHDAPVWQVEWNMLGNWLAASTENGEVCLWRPDLAGEWLLLNKITGGGTPEQLDGVHMN